MYANSSNGQHKKIYRKPVFCIPGNIGINGVNNVPHLFDRGSSDKKNVYCCGSSWKTDLINWREIAVLFFIQVYTKTNKVCLTKTKNRYFNFGRSVIGNGKLVCYSTVRDKRNPPF